MASARIDTIHAHEILDSRGNPTVHVTVLLRDGTRASASVPSGASTGTHEALELRDGDKKRYRGLGVRKAVGHVNDKLHTLLRGMDALDLSEVDAAMLAFDGTPNKRRLGANAILGVSLAVAHAGAKAQGLPLYMHLRLMYNLKRQGWKLPTPLMNVFNGGKHGDTDLVFQEFLLVPSGFRTFARKLQAGSEIFHVLGDILHADGLDTDVGNEGGYAPNVGRTEAVFMYLEKATKRAGYKLGKEVMFGIDPAASEFYDERRERYILSTDRRKLKAPELIDLYEDWAGEYPLFSIEDGLAEDDWGHWADLTKRMGKDHLLIGDDLFVTNAERLKRGVSEGIANAILIKPNQVGTMSETMAAIEYAHAHRYKVVISHRSGETTDTTIADLAVAVNAEFIKSGAPSRSERLAKYNRLLEIEEEITRG